MSTKLKRAHNVGENPPTKLHHNSVGKCLGGGQDGMIELQRGYLFPAQIKPLILRSSTSVRFHFINYSVWLIYNSLSLKQTK